MEIISKDENNRIKFDIRYNKELKPFGVILYLESKFGGNKWQGHNSFLLTFEELMKVVDKVKDEIIN